MLMLLFNLGNSQYAISAREVVEVAPLVRLEAISMAPDYIAGLFNYRGKHVPVIDLSRLIIRRPCENSITTRMILVHLTGASGMQRMLGLIAEQVTETASMDPADFSCTGVEIADAPYLAEATHTENGMIQQIRVCDLLPESVQKLLFPAETG
jgi:chemotaxis-related protein WspB